MSDRIRQELGGDPSGSPSVSAPPYTHYVTFVPANGGEPYSGYLTSDEASYIRIILFQPNEAGSAYKMKNGWEIATRRGTTILMDIEYPYDEGYVSPTTNELGRSCP